MDLESLKQELKQLVVEECDVNVAAQQIDDDERLIGSRSRLGLDSLDALSISLEVKNRYGKHIDSGNQTRKALTSITTLAEFISSE